MNGQRPERRPTGVLWPGWAFSRDYLAVGPARGSVLIGLWKQRLVPSGWTVEDLREPLLYYGSLLGEDASGNPVAALREDANERGPGFHPGASLPLVH